MCGAGTARQRRRSALLQLPIAASNTSLPPLGCSFFDLYRTWRPSSRACSVCSFSLTHFCHSFTCYLSLFPPFLLPHSSLFLFSVFIFACTIETYDHIRPCISFFLSLLLSDLFIVYIRNHLCLSLFSRCITPLVSPLLILNYHAVFIV